MTGMIGRKSLFFNGLVLLWLLMVNTVAAQCPYTPNIVGNATPAGIGSPFVLTNGAFGGQQFTLQANAGCTYQISTCGSTWDTQITVFNPAIVVVGYNDDGCGLQSQVTFTATATGTFVIQLNQYNCAASSIPAQSFVVSILSCPPTGGCNDPSACNYDPADTDASNCCFDECLQIQAGGGFFDEEISWEILDGGTLIAAGVANTPGGLDLCLPEGCYTVNLYDSFGDSWNGAYFNVYNDGNLVFSNSLFVGDFVSYTFCTTYVPPPPPCYSSDPTGCPEIDLGADISLPACEDPCLPLTLNADVFTTGETTAYTICSIDYNPPFPFSGGTSFSVGTDDVWTGVVNLPFDFCFFGTNYSQIIVGSNGLISFDIANAGGYCPWSFTAPCPNPALPLNSIFGVYHDIDPEVCGDLNYSILGSAPCRVFVVNYFDVCHYGTSCNANISSTQIVLYETTNAIEVYVGDKPVCTAWNNGNALIGIQNAAGTVGYVADGRQTGVWTAGNEAWRFTPDGPINVEVNWYDQTGLLGTGFSYEACPSQSSQTFVAEAVYTKCDGTTISVSDDVVVSCATIMLPVTWFYFEAQVVEKDYVACEWATASEQNNSHFVVQKSKDGFEWVDVGQVPGAGWSTQTLHYQLIDKSPFMGASYYRVRQFDVNGAFSDSDIKSVERNGTSDVSLFPNPSNGAFSLSRSDVNVRVFDARGREIPVQHSQPGQYQLLHPSPGCYFLEVYEQEFLLSRQRIIVQ